MEWYKIEPKKEEILQDICSKVQEDFTNIRYTAAEYAQDLDDKFGVYMGKTDPNKKNCYLVLPDNQPFSKMINKYNAKKCDPIDFDELIQIG